MQACADAAAERIAFLEEQVTALMTDLEATSSQAAEAIEAAQDQAAALLAAAAADKEAVLAEAAAHLASSQVHSKMPLCSAVIKSFSHQMSMMHILACRLRLLRFLLACQDAIQEACLESTTSSEEELRLQSKPPWWLI